MANSFSYLSQEEIQDMILPYAIRYAKDMASYSLSVINAFYGHYTPHIYQRKYALPRLWQTDMKPITNGFSITTTFDSSFLGGVHRSDEEVFEHSFLEGCHGGIYAWGRPKSAVPQMQPSPFELIEKYWNSYHF